METRAKTVRKMILSSAVNLETFEKDYKKEIYCVKKNISNFPKETEEDSSEDSEPLTKKKAKRRISPLTRKNIQWFSKPSQRTFTHLSSVNFNAKGKGTAEHISSPIEAWSLLFSDDLLNIILKYTNQEIERNFGKYNSGHDNSLLDMIELKAFIGLLYYAGYKNKTNLKKCFSAHGLPFFRAVTFSRLKCLFFCLLFDDKTTRNERIKSDCFTRIREIWNLFIINCIQYYEPGYNVTIDEQLLNFTGRYTDNMSISSKRNKCGLKIVTMCDSETFYMINAIPYINNVETKPLESFPSYYVRKVSEPIHNTCRNITCGSWFTSVSLVDTMHKKFSLTVVGSLRRDNPEVPSTFKRADVKGTCQFAYHDNKTLVSYKTEKNRMVLLLSSLHADGEIKIENQPEIVLYYNKTKGASNIFDQLCHEYTVNRKTHRWPVRIFYGMMDQAAVNSFVLYTLNADNQVMTRDKFILDLSMSLIKPYFIERLSRPSVPLSAKYLIKAFLHEQGLLEENSSNLRLDISNKLCKRTQCHFCLVSKRKITIYKCLKCDTPMCTIHEASICQSCAEDKFFKHLD